MSASTASPFRQVIASLGEAAHINSDQVGMAMSACAEGIALCDPAGRFIYLNEAHCRMYGYEDASPLIGQLWSVLYRPEELAKFESEYIPELVAKGAWRGQTLGRRRDGTLFDELVSLKLFEDGHILCVCSDMTYLRTVSEQLAGAQERERQQLTAKTRFFSMANHELRSPLASVAVGVEMLALHGEAMTADRRGQICRDVLRRVETVRSILDKFMVIGSQFSGLLAFAPAPWRADEELAALSGLGRGDRALRLENRLPKGQVRLADRVLIEHIVRNLVENACKYGGPSPDVSLVVEGDEAELRLTVSDRGPGIPLEEQPRIFDAFFRAAAAKDRAGSGLGLFLVRQCAEAHQGSVSLRSAPGEGCAFTVRLHAPVGPVAQPERPASSLIAELRP